jgi:hypothetical protein
VLLLSTKYKHAAFLAPREHSTSDDLCDESRQPVGESLLPALFGYHDNVTTNVENKMEDGGSNIDSL